MSGHNKWSKIKREKGANDAKRGAIFNKLGNQIALSARQGTDPSMNPSLALAIEKAKQANMPNQNIERAINRASDKNAALLEELIYEGVGPSGVGIIIEVATDNKNRTLPQVKNTLAKNGGRLADSGSVMFQFSRKGVIVVKGNGEEIILKALEAGAEDVEEDDDETIIYTNSQDLSDVRNKLVEQNIVIIDAELQYIPNVYLEINDQEKQEKILKLIDALDDLEDVINVSANVKLN